MRVEVADMVRGEPAWAALHAANSINSRPQEGREYVLVRLHLTGNSGARWVDCRDFRVIGDERVAHFHAPQVAPEPALETVRLKEGESAEGWCVYSIPANERNLLLMVSEPSTSERRYLALEEGAALVPVRSTPEIPAQPVGESALAGAPRGREVVTRDWSVTAVEIVRGDAARRLVESANPKNEPPKEGREFVAVKFHARYHGPVGKPGLLSGDEFSAIRGDGKPYDRPIVLDVAPRLSRTLLPGGEHTGWAVFQVDPSDTGAVLRFEPYYPDRVVRYFALIEDEKPEAPGHGVEGRSGAVTSAAQPREARIAHPGASISN